MSVLECMHGIVILMRWEKVQNERWPNIYDTRMFSVPQSRYICERYLLLHLTDVVDVLCVSHMCVCVF